MARATDPIKARQAATHIVRRLRDAGHIAYFAGGCVRDGLLGLHPTDYDVATDATPKRVRQIFPRTAEVGAAFGVVLVHVAPHEYGGAADGGLVSVEVATFRSDGPYSDARRPDNVRFSDPRQDAERRDFTINALFLDPLSTTDMDAAARGGQRGDLQGTVIDFVGGVADLNARVLRAVGDPERRLAEDHLRALRAVRFAARLAFDLDGATSAAIRKSAAELRGVSRERIGEELRRMLVHPSRARAVSLLEQLALDVPVLNEPACSSGNALLSMLPQNAAAPTALAAWATQRFRTLAGSGATNSWLSDQQAGDLAKRWRGALMLSNDETEELAGILRSAWVITQRWKALRVSGRKRLAGQSVFGKSLQLVRASEAAVAGSVDRDVREMETDGVGIDPPPVVTGDDLIADGMKPGPRFKGILDEIRDTQLEGGIKTKSEGLELARRLGVQP